MIVVSWSRPETQDWFALDRVRPSSIYGTGVYFVWHAGPRAQVVCLGQGTIATELERIKGDARMRAFKSRGALLVTWATVSAARVDGVERYLADTWPPLIDQPRAQAKPLEVNSPAWLRPFPDEGRVAAIAPAEATG